MERQKIKNPVEDQSSTGILFFMKSQTDAINNSSSSGANIFYGKVVSTSYTKFQIGFYPRVIVYNFFQRDDVSNGLIFGLLYNSKLNTAIKLSAISDGYSSVSMSYYGYIKFYESSVDIKVEGTTYPIYFAIFG